MANDLTPEIFQGRRIMVDDVPTPESFRGDDEAGGYGQPEAFQFDQIEPLVADENDAGKVFAALIHRGKGLAGVILEKEAELIWMQGVQLVKQDVQYPGQQPIQLLKPQ